MLLEVGQESEEDGQRQLKDLWHRADPILGQGYTQVLFDGIDEHVVGAEHWPCILQDWEQQLQRQDLGTQLVWPVEIKQ